MKQLYFQIKSFSEVLEGILGRHIQSIIGPLDFAFCKEYIEISFVHFWGGIGLLIIVDLQDLCVFYKIVVQNMCCELNFTFYGLPFKLC